MNTTENYGLNQWESTDRILMDNFNADNRKIDAALHGVVQKMTEDTAQLSAANCYVKLADVTLEETSAQMDVDISAIDLRLYEKLIIRPLLNSSTTSAYQMRLDGISDNVYAYTTSSSNTTGDSCGGFAPNNLENQEIELYFTGNHVFVPSRKMNSYGIITTQCYAVPASYFGETGPNTLNFLKTSGTLTAGSRVRIYGIKR